MIQVHTTEGKQHLRVVYCVNKSAVRVVIFKLGKFSLSGCTCDALLDKVLNVGQSCKSFPTIISLHTSMICLIARKR